MQAIKVICDTNIISNYLGEKGKPEIKQEVLDIGLENIAITSVVYIELIRWLSAYKGFSKSERMKCKTFFNSLKVLHLNKEISVRAMENALKADSVDAADILIATTAMYYDLPVFTDNTKHFKQIKGIKLHTPKK
ncbi:PIN domain-containing protein [Capnocytophaga sp.]|uniref:PIN domain-containing protein n=1 Tax=Capnocytophaga sp. TaxID=44737 RepID=UPI0026DAACD2|nr:PIN domain-containing protein [Capnocytophaga sp.]MDO5106280.1 PIN domain-containing protein [Capnocytophaga sp.]